ncbi:unnamed protein product [Phaeothamnion confervicola]
MAAIGGGNDISSARTAIATTATTPTMLSDNGHDGDSNGKVHKPCVRGHRRGGSGGQWGSDLTADMTLPSTEFRSFDFGSFRAAASSASLLTATAPPSPSVVGTPRSSPTAAMPLVISLPLLSEAGPLHVHVERILAARVRHGGDGSRQPLQGDIFRAEARPRAPPRPAGRCGGAGSGGGGRGGGGARCGGYGAGQCWRRADRGRHRAGGDGGKRAGSGHCYDRGGGWSCRCCGGGGGGRWRRECRGGTGQGSPPAQPVGGHPGRDGGDGRDVSDRSGLQRPRLLPRLLLMRPLPLILRTLSKKYLTFHQTAGRRRDFRRAAWGRGSRKGVPFLSAPRFPDRMR